MCGLLPPALMHLHVQDIFGQLLGLLQALAGQAAGRQGLLGCPRSLKQLRGVTQLLARRMDIERKYIQRLEGEQAPGRCVPAPANDDELLQAPELAVSMASACKLVRADSAACGGQGSACLQAPLAARGWSGPSWHRVLIPCSSTG